MVRDIAIIGGGFSGALLAINLLRHDGPRATLIERSPQAGSGLAFGAAHPMHLLNVRAANMSAYPDDPHHFVRWLAAAGLDDAAARFVPRLTYGRYLQAQLQEASARAGGQLRIVQGEAIDMSTAGRPLVVLGDGRTIAADAVVLAIGNLPPHHPAALDPDELDADLYRGDPWLPGLADGLADHDDVLIVGTGLTMVDVALSLRAKGFAGRMIAVSRRGLLPHRHALTKPVKPLATRPPIDPAQLLAGVRRAADRVGWREAVDALRPMTQILWAAADEVARARFLRHLRPWWDIHRHRLAPEVADQLAALIDAGDLQIHAARLVAFARSGNSITITCRRRGEAQARQFNVRRIINCTGPQGDLLRSGEPLLRCLLARGLIRPDRARLGIDVTPQAKAIDALGRPVDWLFAIGPMTRGAFWEIVAVPDIRAQTWSLARCFANAQWVGGEGL